MNFRILATIVLSASLAWGCGSPDSSAAQPEPSALATTFEGTATPLISTSASTLAAATSDSRGGTTSPATTATTATNPTTTMMATTATATPTASTSNPLLARTARILPLGDSMTAGHEYDPLRFRSYRGPLYALLGSAGFKVDFVGTQQMMPAMGGDPDHDGYGGAWIGPGGSDNTITARLPGIFAAVDPDIVILAMGWNSVYNEPAVAASKYRDLVNRIAAAKPNAHIVVATLSPQRGQTEAQTNADVAGYAALNATARSLASASTTDRIHLADYAMAGFQDAEYWDVIHWLQPGADRAGRVLFQALVNGPLKR